MTTRRQFLTNVLLAAPVATVSALATAAALESSSADECELLPTAPPPFGPPERTAIIDDWRARIDSTIVALEKFWGYLGEARALPTDQVDGVQLFDLQVNAEIAMDKLEDALTYFRNEDNDIDALYRLTTGHKEYFWCLKRDTLKGGKAARGWIQSQIDAVRKDDPASALELQAILDARMGVQ